MEKEKVASQLRPLPAGTVFSGVIRYRNLRPEELGLLLWSLRLEEGCCQAVGMGKPYGYGRMRIDSLREFDLLSLYRFDGLCAGAVETPDMEAAIQKYIDQYDAFAVQALNLKLTSKEKKQKKKRASLRNQAALKNFFFLRSEIWNTPKDVSYMDLQEYQNIRNSLPDAATIRKNKEEAQKAAEKENAQKAFSMEDRIAEFNRTHKL